MNVAINRPLSKKWMWSMKLRQLCFPVGTGVRAGDFVISINGLAGETLPQTSCCQTTAIPSQRMRQRTLCCQHAALEAILREYIVSDACGNTLTLQEQFNVTVANPGCLDDAACNYDSEANVDDDLANSLLWPKCMRVSRLRSLQLRQCS